MDEVQMQRALTTLTHTLSTLGATAQRHSLVTHCQTPQEVLNHCLYMTAEMHCFLEAKRHGKFFRWLGFVQGVLWTLGHHTLDELKEQNRPH